MNPTQQSGPAEQPITTAQIIELWGDGPIFPGPGWRLNWPLATEIQQRLNAALLSGQLWSTLQTNIPELAQLPEPWQASRQSSGHPSVIALKAIAAMADVLLKPARLEIREPHVAVKLRTPHLVLYSDQHELAGNALQIAAAIVLTGYMKQQRKRVDLGGLQKALTDLMQKVRLCCGHSLTTAQLAEARCRGIPIFLIDPTQRLYQLGTGIHSRWISSTSNDHDSAFGVAIACNKSKTHDLLRQLGLPVPREIRLPQNASDKQLIAAADQIGYPCVLKPQDGERGRGVTANIENPAELLQAARKAKSHTKKSLLLQNHVHGHDFRINVINGEITFAIRRTPPCITGNGINTISELIEIENIKRRSSKNTDHISGEISLNDPEVQYHIEKAGFGQKSIPHKGRQIQLLGNANISTGGLREEIDPNIIHPIICQQCLAIANTLRLETCGIDYICSDISAAPSTCPGAFIEANSMPQNSAKRAIKLLDNIFPDNTDHSIPITIILGDWDQKDSTELNEQAVDLISSRQTATIGIPVQLEAQIIPILDKKHQQRTYIYTNPRELLINRSISEIIHITSINLVFKHGLPAPKGRTIFSLASNDGLQPNMAWMQLLGRYNDAHMQASRG